MYSFFDWQIDSTSAARGSCTCVSSSGYVPDGCAVDSTRGSSWLRGDGPAAAVKQPVRYAVQHFCPPSFPSSSHGNSPKDSFFFFWAFPFAACNILLKGRGFLIVSQKSAYNGALHCLDTIHLSHTPPNNPTICILQHTKSLRHIPI